MQTSKFDFKSSQEFPEFQKFIINDFLYLDTYETIIPAKESEVGKYLNLMDNNFNISTIKEARAAPDTAFKPGVSGTYNTATNTASINTAYPEIFPSTFVHEAGSHGTDDQVQNILIKDYPFTIRPAGIFSQPLNPTVKNIYGNIATTRPITLASIKSKVLNPFKKSQPSIDKDSDKWYEARATLNQVRFELFRFVGCPSSWKSWEK